MRLGGEDVVVDIDGKLALLREQQVEVFKHLGQEKRVHPADKHTFRDFQVPLNCP